MTENIDNLIAEARDRVLPNFDVKNGEVGQKSTGALIMVLADALEALQDQNFAYAQGYRAALEAVQPVTPEALAAVMHNTSPGELDHEGAAYKPMYLSWANRIVASLASGVLGQPQPQPTKAQLIEAIEGAWTDDDPEFSSVIADALLPLLGQPRTEEWGVTWQPSGTQHRAVGVLEDEAHAREWAASAVDFDPIVVKRSPAPGPWVPVEQDQARYPRTDTPVCKHEDTFEDGTQQFCSDCGETVRHLNADLDDWVQGPPDSDLRWTDEGFRARYPRTDTTEPGDKP